MTYKKPKTWSCHLTTTRWVWHVEKELHVLSYHMSIASGISGGNITKRLAFCVLFCKTIVCLFVRLSAIVLFVFLPVCRPLYCFSFCPFVGHCIVFLFVRLVASRVYFNGQQYIRRIQHSSKCLNDNDRKK